jgi:hypothetical protein
MTYVGKSFKDAYNSARQPLDESVSKFNTSFSREYRSGRRHSFKEWLGVMVELIDILD